MISPASRRSTWSRELARRGRSRNHGRTHRSDTSSVFPGPSGPLSSCRDWSGGRACLPRSMRLVGPAARMRSRSRSGRIAPSTSSHVDQVHVDDLVVGEGGLADRLEPRFASLSSATLGAGDRLGPVSDPSENHTASPSVRRLAVRTFMRHRSLVPASARHRSARRAARTA